MPWGRETPAARSRPPLHAQLRDQREPIVEQEKVREHGLRHAQQFSFDTDFTREDFTDKLYVTNPNPAHQIKARIEVIEPMGSEIFLYLSTGKHTFIARMDAREKADVNQELEMVLDLKKAHFFEIDSGNPIV